MKVNHAILHMFDFVSCENSFSREEMDLTDKTAKNYVARHVRKALGNLDNKRGAFEPDSHFARRLRAYFTGECTFTDLSVEVGEFLARELGHMEKPTSTDLLMVDFEESANASASDGPENAFDGAIPRYLAILLLESKPAYVHDERYGDAGSFNTISRHHAVLPNTSQKVSSYAVVNLRTLNVVFCDKQRTIAGEECWLIPDKLLQCSMEASSKETFRAVTEIVEAVAEEYGHNTTVALSRAKAYAVEYADNADSGFDDLDLSQMADAAFEGDPVLKQRFEAAARSVDIPARVPLERQAVKRVAKSQKIRTDTGIEITFPAEYSRNPEYITFTSESDGTISIQLKNISSIENRS